MANESKIKNLRIVWKSMMERCYNANNIKYKYYGGKGVTVCLRWKDDFQSFYDWAITRWKQGLQLDKDKKSSTGKGVLYCPELCCFLTPKENSSLSYKGKNFESKNIYFNGENLTLKECSARTGIPYETLKERIGRLKWPIEKALNTPVLRKMVPKIIS